ncbi:cache domain-containing sensor histidine kinase [Alkalihalobacillus sp. 1P02AB]|uniref:cache domain-containing sensor histidine kinase n=1 Tax=Alkalihalobacillus sp. 1P02AB TaxID=3132260 RepID=UPI0039A55751
MERELEKLYRQFFLRNLSVYLIPMIIPILILGSVSYLIIQNIIVTGIEDQNRRAIEQTKTNLDMITQELDTLSLTVVASAFQFTQLQEILNNPYPNQAELVELAHLKNFIDSPSIGKEYIDSIYIYAPNSLDQFLSTEQGGISNPNNHADNQWVKYLGELEKMEVDSWTEKRTIFKTGIAYKQYQKNVLSFFQKVPIGSDDTGLLILNVDEAFISNQLKKFTMHPDQQVFLLNERDEILASNRVNLESIYPLLSQIDFQVNGSALIESANGNMISTTLSSEQSQLKFVSLIPEKSLYRLPNQLLTLIITTLLISFVIGVFYALYHTRQAGTHLRTIIDLLNHAKTHTQIPLHTRQKNNNLYSYITEKVLKNFIKHDYLQMQISNHEYKNQAAQFNALQSQLNPHFLYNTLETINWRATALTGGHNSLNEMVELLSDVLRYSLDEPGNLVSIKKERRYTESYIRIQQIRYQDKFEVEWSIDEAAHQYLIPKMILQPLIENSLSHGFKEGHEQGQIKIKIHVRSSLLLLDIIDNGIGMSQERLNTVRQQLVTESTVGRHIGLSNTHKRLQIIYGVEHGLEVDSKQNWGTRIRIRIPI